jgi:hypothetical protein
MLVDFEWPRDVQGYRPVTGALPIEKPEDFSWHAVLFNLGRDLRGERPITPERIVPVSGKFVVRRPLAEFSGGKLHLYFAKQGRTKEGLLMFTQQFGPLTETGNDETGEWVQTGLDAASKMNEWLAKSPEDQAAEVARLGEKGLLLANIEVALACNPMTGKPQFQLKPPDLLSALWLELAQFHTGGTTIKRCKQCGDWFAAGPGTGRRAAADYCSPAHQVAFNSLKRSKGRAANA